MPATRASKVVGSFASALLADGSADSNLCGEGSHHVALLISIAAEATRIKFGGKHDFVASAQELLLHSSEQIFTVPSM